MNRMKHGIAIKFIAILLTALALILAAVGGAGILILEANGLYSTTLEDQQQEWYDNAGSYIAWEYACRYAAEHLGGCSDALLDRLYNENYYGMEPDFWQTALYLDGKRIDQTLNVIDNPIIREYTFTVEYPVASTEKPVTESNTEAEPAISSGARYFPEATVPSSEPLYIVRQTIWENGEMVDYYLRYYTGPTYTVRVQMHPDLTQRDPQAILVNMYPYRYTFIMILVSGLILFAAGLVFLLWSAGKTRDGKIRPSALNRLPLDLYGIAATAGICLLCVLFTELVNWSDYDGLSPAILTLMGLNAMGIALLLIGFLFALAAQAKMKQGFWWKHTVIGFCVYKLWCGIRFLLRGFRLLFRMLPAIWQWFLTAFLMAFSVFFTLVLTVSAYYAYRPFFLLLFLLAIGVCVGIVCYGGYAFGTLLIGAQKMTQGNLSYKIPTQYLFGSFRDFAEQLNALSETAMLSAKKQLKSERMKTELITNVSHDIKTPLTSIINFVDLLQKPHTPEEGKQYLEVLSRQSARMKKLIEDLMDLSKASTGDMSVNIVQIDAAETVNQALGEFADKLDSAQLIPVFRQPETSVMMKADGRLVWRVLSNLLSNAVKYAMPGTRLYIDLIRVDKQVVLSLKNISREELRVSAEELMERFVQGDASRNTEGSGLGLNIARSLMEVQHGQLHLTLDGDLFKVTLLFPGV